MRRAILVGSLLMGCTYPEKEFSVLACNEDPPPTTAAQSSVVGGAVFDPRSMTPLSGMSVTLLSDDFAVVDGPKTSGANGSFGLVLPLSGGPFSRAYLKADGNPDYIETYLANTRPITGDVQLPFGVVSIATVGDIAQGTLGPGMQFPPGTGTFIIKVHDCNDAPIVGATVRTTPERHVYYFDGPDPADLAATTSLGVVLVADLPTGDVTVDVTVGGEQFRTQIYRSVADAFTQFDITP